MNMTAPPLPFPAIAGLLTPGAAPEGKDPGATAAAALAFLPLLQDMLAGPPGQGRPMPAGTPAAVAPARPFAALAADLAPAPNPASAPNILAGQVKARIVIAQPLVAGAADGGVPQMDPAAGGLVQPAPILFAPSAMGMDGALMPQPGAGMDLPASAVQPLAAARTPDLPQSTRGMALSLPPVAVPGPGAGPAALEIAPATTDPLPAAVPAPGAPLANAERIPGPEADLRLHLRDPAASPAALDGMPAADSAAPDPAEPDPAAAVGQARPSPEPAAPGTLAPAVPGTPVMAATVPPAQAAAVPAGADALPLPPVEGAAPVNLMKVADEGLKLAPRPAAAAAKTVPARGAGHAAAGPAAAHAAVSSQVQAAAASTPSASSPTESAQERHMPGRQGILARAGYPAAQPDTQQAASAATTPGAQRPQASAQATPADPSPAAPARSAADALAALAGMPAADEGPGSSSQPGGIRDLLQLGAGPERVEQTGLALAARGAAALDRGAAGQPYGMQQPGHPPPAQQLGLALQYRIGRGETRFALRLDPPELGRIEVALKLHGDGRVDALVKAEHGHALELLQRDARMLERAFQQLGLKPEGGIQFTTGQGGQQHGQPGFADGHAAGGHPGHHQPAPGGNRAGLVPGPGSAPADAVLEPAPADAAGPALGEAVLGVDVRV